MKWLIFAGTVRSCSGDLFGVAMSHCFFIVLEVFFTNLLWTYFFFKVLSSWPSLKMAACLWLELWGILCRLWKLWVKGTTEWGRSWCACSHPAIVKDTASRIWKSERTAWRNGWRRTTSLSPSREMHRGRCVWLGFWLSIRPMLQKIAAAPMRSFCPAFGTLFKDISQLPSERGQVLWAGLLQVTSLFGFVLIASIVRWWYYRSSKAQWGVCVKFLFRSNWVSRPECWFPWEVKAQEEHPMHWNESWKVTLLRSFSVARIKALFVKQECILNRYNNVK